MENDPADGRKTQANGGRLSDEIKFVRMLIRQVEKKIENGEEVQDVLKVVETIARASANLAILLKAEKALEAQRSSADYIRAALEEIRADMKKKGIDSILTSGLD